MNTARLVAAAALALLGSSAFAGGEFDPMTGFNLQPAAATAKAAPAAKPAGVTAPAASNGLTREQVRAEFLRSRNDPTDDAVQFDRGNDFAKAPAGASRDRDTVRAEARTAVRGGKTGS